MGTGGDEYIGCQFGRAELLWGMQWNCYHDNCAWTETITGGRLFTEPGAALHSLFMW